MRAAPKKRILPGGKVVTFGRTQPWTELRYESSGGNTPGSCGMSVLVLQWSSGQHTPASTTISFFHHLHAPASDSKFSTYWCSSSRILVNFFFLKKLTRGSLVRWTTAAATASLVATIHTNLPPLLPILDSLTQWSSFLIASLSERVSKRVTQIGSLSFCLLAGKIMSRIYCNSCYKFFLSHHGHREYIFSTWMLI